MLKLWDVAPEVDCWIFFSFSEPVALLREAPEF